MEFDGPPAGSFLMGKDAVRFRTIALENPTLPELVNAIEHIVLLIRAKAEELKANIFWRKKPEIYFSENFDYCLDNSFRCRFRVAIYPEPPESFWEGILWKEEGVKPLKLEEFIKGE